MRTHLDLTFEEQPPMLRIIKVGKGFIMERLASSGSCVPNAVDLVFDVAEAKKIVKEFFDKAGWCVGID